MGCVWFFAQVEDGIQLHLLLIGYIQDYPIRRRCSYPRTLCVCLAQRTLQDNNFGQQFRGHCVDCLSDFASRNTRLWIVCRTDFASRNTRLWIVLGILSRSSYVVVLHVLSMWRRLLDESCCCSSQNLQIAANRSRGKECAKENLQIVLAERSVQRKICKSSFARRSERSMF